ncbi:MAG: hypothetical protein IH605_01350 [Burkholderiales bacterium]|nr:hypothetical protein [Burkholderiales bacterium]
MRLDCCRIKPYLSHIQRILGRWFRQIEKEIEMKLYPPMYPGDSILHPGSVPGGDVEDTGAKAAIQPLFVRSSISEKSAPESRIDLVAIEERARAARSAWIGGQLKTLYATLARKFERIAQDRLQRQLTASNRVCHS